MTNYKKKQSKAFIDVVGIVSLEESDNIYQWEQNYTKGYPSQ